MEKIAAVYYKDRANVNFLTNCDLIDVKKSDAEGYIPAVVKMYRLHMGHVDKADSFLSKYLFSNRNRKWTDAHFKACLKICVDNSWIIYKQLKNENISLEQFIVDLAKEMVNEYRDDCAKKCRTNSKTRTELFSQSNENGQKKQM